MEINAAGEVNTYYMNRSFRFNLYISTSDWVRLALEIVFTILIIYFIFVEVAEVFTFVFLYSLSSSSFC